MNWINDLQKAINYLEDNLTEDISYGDVAGQANYSPYYFQNIFSILCGCTLGEYIRCRRLTLAGKELASTKCRQDQTLDKLSAYQAAEDIFGNALIGMCLSENAQEKEITYAIGAGYHGEPVGEGLSVERIAANTWVVFEGTGPMPGAFQRLLKKVYSEFFPASEYRPLSGMDIQVYPQGDMQSPQYRCELWIPVETDK